MILVPSKLLVIDFLYIIESSIFLDQARVSESANFQPLPDSFLHPKVTALVGASVRGPVDGHGWTMMGGRPQRTELVITSRS